MTKPELIDELFLVEQWVKSLKDSGNMNCAVMLSGGKDSALTLGVLDRIGMNVEALHFTNRWTWGLSTSESERICDILGVKLNIYDITDDFVSEVVGKVEGVSGIARIVVETAAFQPAGSYASLPPNAAIARWCHSRSHSNPFCFQYFFNCVR